jgi:methanethiol S-methyltransferase
MIRWLAIVIVAAAIAVEVYFLGFLQNWTPRGIDDGVLRPWPLALAINLALLALFGVTHSVMARPAFKRAWTRVIPPSLERVMYLLVAGVTLALLCALWSPIPAPLWQVDWQPGRQAIYALFFAGIALTVWAVHVLDPLSFHGLRQVFRPGAGEPAFSVRGPYRFVRHPIQTGLIVALWSTPDLTVGHALLAGVFTAYSVLATLRLEERDLVAAIGEPYREYSRRVPALLPWRRPPPGNEV